MENFKKNLMKCREDNSITTWLDLDVIDGNRWAIVGCYDDEVGYLIKLAYQPINSVMQEYDIDWIMPCDDFGTYDTEIVTNLSNLDDDIETLKTDYYSFLLNGLHD